MSSCNILIFVFLWPICLRDPKLSGSLFGAWMHVPTSVLPFAGYVASLPVMLVLWTFVTRLLRKRWDHAGFLNHVWSQQWVTRVMLTTHHSLVHGWSMLGNPRGSYKARSPLVNPCYVVQMRSETCGSLDSQQCCAMRCDLDCFLNPLFGCHFVCSCKLPGLLRHASHLLSWCDTKAKSHGNDDDQPNDHPYMCCTLRREGFDDSNVEIDHADRITSPL